MRRIVNDASDRLPYLVSVFNGSIRKWLTPQALDSASQYSNGMRRVQVNGIHNILALKLGEYEFEITNRVQHAHGIGNNNAYEIIDAQVEDFEETIARLSLVNDMFGGVYACIQDVDGKRISNSYEINPGSVRLSK